jgi:hypothetical protein
MEWNGLRYFIAFCRMKNEIKCSVERNGSRDFIAFCRMDAMRYLGILMHSIMQNVECNKVLHIMEWVKIPYCNLQMGMQ